MANQNSTYAVSPVAWVRSTRMESFDDNWDRESTTIELDDSYGEDALLGLSEFSHVEVVFLFDRIEPETVHTGARRPRNNPEWPLAGIFAQRGARRPNRIGVTRCRLLAVKGRTLNVQGLDAIDGTPILDVKPVLREFEARGDIRQPEWATELMSDYF